MAVKSHRLPHALVFFAGLTRTLCGEWAGNPEDSGGFKFCSERGPTPQPLLGCAARCDPEGLPMKRATRRPKITVTVQVNVAMIIASIATLIATLVHLLT
jgi:hypothetical protein